MVLRQLDVHMQNNAAGPPAHTIYKFLLIIHFSTRTETMTLFEENTGVNLVTLGLEMASYIWYQQHTQVTKEKNQINQTSSILNTFVLQRTLQRMWKDNPLSGRKYLQITSAKGYTHTQNDKKKTQLKIGFGQTSLKQDTQMGNKYIKGYLTPLASGKCKSKPQGDTTPHSLGWPSQGQ